MPLTKKDAPANITPEGHETKRLYTLHATLSFEAESLEDARSVYDEARNGIERFVMGASTTTLASVEEESVFYRRQG